MMFLVAALIAAIVALTAPNAGERTETFQGVWRDGFETAAFYEGFTAENWPYPDAAPDGWLSFEAGVWPSESRSPDDQDWAPHALFEITFVGHRVVGRAGHLGQYPAEYFAERVISIERIDQSDAEPEATRSSSIEP